MNTFRFGEISVTDDQEVHLPDGLPGFPSARQFYLLDRAEDWPIRWLQSADDPALVFAVVDPEPIISNYRPMIPPRDQERLGIFSAQDAMVLVILTIPSDPRTITANLRAPVIINATTRCGKQVVLPDENWPTRYPLFSHLNADAAGCSGGEPHVDS